MLSKRVIRKGYKWEGKDVNWISLDSKDCEDLIVKA